MIRIDCSEVNIITGIGNHACVVQCQRPHAHAGKHRFEVEWADPREGGEEADVREPRRPKPDAGVMVATREFDEEYGFK